jgi:uncharacterized protein with GYD domain
MPKYLIEANYTPEGIKGVLAKGGTARREAVEKMAAEVGGTVESFHFGFGATDAFVIVDVPDNVTAAGMAMLVSASGMAAARTTVLLTPEEVDRAAKINVTYRPPGS